MLKLERFFSTGIQINLVNITYNSIDLSSEDSNFNIHCQDSLKTKLNGDRSLSAFFTRKVFLDPKALFELSVTYEAVMDIDEDSKDEINDIDFDKEISENGEDILMILASKCSLLISQITSASGQNPIITPPNFINETK